MVFIMADYEASGHSGKQYNYQAMLMEDDNLLERIRQAHRTIDVGDIYTIMEAQYNVPALLIPYILHEIKTTIGLI